jgi:hypothetical protein
MTYSNKEKSQRLLRCIFAIVEDIKERKLTHQEKLAIIRLVDHDTTRPMKDRAWYAISEVTNFSRSRLTEKTASQDYLGQLLQQLSQSCKEWNPNGGANNG